jgi:hypothetical protein
MRKEKQIRFCIKFPASFTEEAENVYRHASVEHMGLTFSGFHGFLIRLGLEEYRNIAAMWSLSNPFIKTTRRKKDNGLF